MEVFLAFQKLPVEPATEVRSTLILEGIQAVRARNLFTRYAESLSAEERTDVLGLAGGAWVPVKVAVQHYAALDRLKLDDRTIEGLGEEVATRAWKHVLAPTLARSKRIGPKPWESLASAHDTLRRTWRGSDVRIFKEGPTQALYEWAGQPCAAVPYFVRSFAGMMRTVTNLFASQATAELVPRLSSRTTVAVRIAWAER